MDIGVELSLYPLADEYIPPIKSFIERLRGSGLRVETNSLSTQVFGAYEEVFAVLTREMRTTFGQLDKAVFVMKVVGPLSQ
jgi:uncharacterized protein YqgV (UPF0045/DUF77 family)